MSSLKVRQLKNRLLTMFEPALDKYGISDSDPEREVKILSRCLAAFGVYSATGCTLEEASASVWDGGDDNGIDAAFFDPVEDQVVVVQSKWIQSGSGEPEAKDIGTFADGVRDLVESNIHNFGTRLHSKVEQISEKLMQPGVTVKLIVASTGSSSLAQHGTRKLERILTELNSEDEDGIASFEVLGMNEVFETLTSDASAGRINLTVNILEWARVTHPHRAYFGLIDGAQLKAWWTQHGKRIVSRNIRYALGDTDVNLQIRKTAMDDPEHFWYFNNGITLIAEDAERAPMASASRASGIFDLKGVSLVNGAQTVSSLAKVENDQSLGNVRVSVRIVLLKDAPDNFGADVTRTNNLQNRVEGRDFVAHDPEQTRIKGEMSLEGIEYQFHRSGDFISNPTACDLVEVTTALACASPDASHAVAAKTGIGRFYLDLSKAPYKAIFNARTTGSRAFNAVRVLRAVDSWLAEKRAKAQKRSGYSWGLLVHGNRMIAACVFARLGQHFIDRSISDMDTDYEQAVHNACESVYPNMLQVLEQDFPNRALAVLFKSVSNCRTLAERVKQMSATTDILS